jgi:predicted kinase
MSKAKFVPNKMFVIFLYGFPGAGKTTFARHMAEEVKCAHLQHDRISNKLYGEKSDDFEMQSRETLNFMTNEFLNAGVSVIYDADVHRMAERRMLRGAARNSKAIPVLIWMQIDPETAYNRTKKRDPQKQEDMYAQSYSAEQYDTTLKQMQNPDNEDYIVISGKHTFHTQRAAVFKKLYELNVLTPAQLSRDIAKPELVNLVPQNQIGRRPDDIRRNINIR